MTEIIKINLNSTAYPKLLAQIADPPKQLYCRGNLELLNSDCLGVVGTRKLTPYGKESAQYITRGLINAGFTIASGLAMGIDAIAHQTSIDNKGKTIAVLGGGVSDKNIGPKINLPLSRKILENNGLIISEYPDNDKVYPTNFAARNRIISGLSKGIIVIEADRDSGSLITAKCALDQNRDVFAVPGNIFSNKSSGSNDLIKTGAKLITSAGDVLEEYGHNLSFFDKAKGFMSTQNSFNKDILDILEQEGEVSAQEISSYLPSIDISDILSSLSELELSGLVKVSGQGKYQISK